jgi:hypothetical protein
MSCEDKYRALRSIYDDAEDGLDTLNSRYAKAHKATPSITFEYTKQWFAKQKLRQGRPSRVCSSYLSPEPRHQYGVDIADFQKIADKNDQCTYQLLCVDTFANKDSGFL